jgi:SAM-dependent methyltransferase
VETIDARSEHDSRPVETGAWIPKVPSPDQHPHMSDDFARAYARTANRITGAIALMALDRVGSIGAGTRLIDVAAGARSLSVPAAERGAAVLAIDHAPGMVRLLAERLAAFPGCEARLMDGQALALEGGAFDAAFSIVGVSFFPDWRGGLRELHRVLRPGGRAGVACWRTPLGGGPFLLMAQALRSVFPDRAPPPLPDGVVALTDPARLAAEMQDAGFTGVDVAESEVVWEGPAGEAYLAAMGDMHAYMGPYAQLAPPDRREVDAVILSLVNDLAEGDRVSLRSPVLIATGARP